MRFVQLVVVNLLSLHSDNTTSANITQVTYHDEFQVLNLNVK